MNRRNYAPLSKKRSVPIAELQKNKTMNEKEKKTPKYGCKKNNYQIERINNCIETQEEEKINEMISNYQNLYDQYTSAVERNEDLSIFRIVMQNQVRAITGDTVSLASPVPEFLYQDSPLSVSSTSFKPTFNLKDTSQKVFRSHEILMLE